jgi:hypothetical protein
VFVGKIVQIKELYVVKEQKPRTAGAFLVTDSILSSGIKLMGRFLACGKWLVSSGLCDFPRFWGLDNAEAALTAEEGGDPRKTQKQIGGFRHRQNDEER